MDRAGHHARGVFFWVAVVLALGMGGCDSPSAYVHNGFKVGPNYGPPQAQVAKHWIDAADVRVRSDSPDLSHWWTVFNDPVLNTLICDVYRQNLTLKEAGMRVLEARAQLAIARGELFPQTQQETGGYSREGVAVNPKSPSGGARFFNQWNYGFNLAWELDFWGRFRRAIEAADANLCSSVENYDDVLVTLLADAANTYVTARTDQQRIALARANADFQRWVRDHVRDKVKFGMVSRLDLAQADTNLATLEATIPPLEADLRQQEDHLCILLGMPPCDLRERLGVAPIPAAPVEAVVGIPAELLNRRPDVREAQFNAAAQAEQIGIAQAGFYPAISITGTLNYQAQNFPDLFKSTAFGGSVGPSFQWSILNYGRILNNVRFQDATFQQLLFTYCETVLEADQDVEQNIAVFLQSQQQERILNGGSDAAKEAMEIVIQQYLLGAKVEGVSVDFNRVSVIEQQVAQVQDQLAQSRGKIATGLVQVYRALGGGWQLRLAPQEGKPAAAPPAATQPPEMIQAPTVPENAAPGAGGAAPGAAVVAPNAAAAKKPLPPIPEPVLAPAPAAAPQPVRTPLP
jgi:NodT family efflux transporter outer membrane factor (OMF) lipoprotein